MASSSSLLFDYLVEQQKIVKETLQCIEANKNYECEITLVLGNEACDLDSIVSALLWSFYNSQKHNSKDSKKLFIPILTIPKKELKLRKDAIYLFEQIDAKNPIIDNLFFVDTIHKTLSHLPSLSTSEEQKENEKENKARINLSVHLMDHNNLSISLHPLLGNYVNYIIDHHVDEKNYINQCNDNQRIIKFVGSNVTNVIDHILSIDENFDIASIGKVFGSLINAVILLDTAAFDKKMNKTTEHDIKIYELFKEYNLMKDVNTWYDVLLKHRCDMQGFTFADLLLKDLKIFKENEIIFGIPGLGLSFQSAVESEGEKVFTAIDTFKNEKNLDLVAVGSVFSENNALQRQLALFCSNESLFEHVSKALESQKDILKPIEIGKYFHKSKFMLPAKNFLHYQWWNVDVAVSRKKLVPLLRKILKASKL